MKGRNLILTALITLIAGALMLVYRNALASHGIVIGCGILFILAGVANMTVFLGERDKDGRARMSAAGTALGWVASAAAVVLGVVMLLFRTVFEAMVGYMFAILLLFGALFQFLLLIFGSRPVKLSGWFFLVPMALVGAAVYIFMQQPGAGDYNIMVATGASFAFFGLMTLAESFVISAANRSARKAAKAAAGQPAPTAPQPVETVAVTAPAATPEAAPATNAEKLPGDTREDSADEGADTLR